MKTAKALQPHVDTEQERTVRLDTWLWAARFFRTRSLAQQAVTRGKVLRNNRAVKPAHPIAPGDLLHIVAEHGTFTVKVTEVFMRRGPASEAARLYEELEESKYARSEEIRKKREQPFLDPGKRPTKKQRRERPRIRDGE